MLRFVEEAFQLAQRAVARYSSKFSKQRYTLHQHIVLLCLKVRKNTTYHTLLDELIEMPRIRSAINLTELPAPSTLCKAFDRLDMAVWRVLLNLSVSLLPTNGVTGIDASGFDRSHASKHYTKRTKLTIQQLKVTLLVDTRANAILDIHITPSLINRNASEIEVLLGDKGYDDQQIRRMARENGVRPLIKHREFSSLQKAWNARLETELCGQQSQSETVNSRLKRKYVAFVRSRRWWKQFRELALACIVHNLDRAI
nr:IS5 family transposase [Natronolimnobius sp. AArcel1]